MRKRKIRWLVLIAAILVLSGMAAVLMKTREKGEESGEASWFNQAMGLAFATEDGFFHTDSRNFLYFYDFQEEQDVIVCNKPDCRHEEIQEDTPEEEKCNAYLSGLTCGFVSGKQLYVIEIDPARQQADIIRSAMDRSGQEKVGTLALHYLDTFVVTDDGLYLAGSQQEMTKDEAEMEIPSGRAKTWLYRVDLKTGEVQKVTKESVDYNAAFQIAGIWEEKIYCRYSYFDQLYDGSNFEEAGAHTSWYAYDIDSGAYEEVIPDGGPGSGFDIGEGTLLYDQGEADGSYTIWQANLKTKEVTRCAVSETAPLYVDGKAFIQKDGRDQYYDPAAGEIKSLNHHLLDRFYFWQDAGAYFYGAVRREDSLGDTPALIRKDDFYAGKDRFVLVTWNSPKELP